MLSGSELWLLRLMADRGLALLDADGVLVVIEEKGELRVAAASGSATPRLRIAPVHGSALGTAYLKRESLALERPAARRRRGCMSSASRPARYSSSRSSSKVTAVAW